MRTFTRRILPGFLALAATVSFGSPAQATQFLYTISGTVTGDELTYDDWHLFDPEQGEAFSAAFVLDDAAPLALYDYGATGSSASGGGLVQLGTRTPLIASLTIGGSTYAIRTGDFHQYPNYDPETGDPSGPTDLADEYGMADKRGDLGKLSLSSGYSQSHSCCFPHPGDSYGEGEELSFSLLSAALADADYRQTGTFALAAGSGGYFGKSEYIVDRPGYLTQILLKAQTLTVSQIGAVPEVATWLMMIVGIGAVGLALRRKAMVEELGAGTLC